MTFFWPASLWLLLTLPAMVALYVLLSRRKKKEGLRYANLAMVKAAMKGGSWRRHIPPLLLLAAFTVMILAMARPAASVILPSRQGTVILAMDISGSMRATDIAPNRITAAQDAAVTFIREQPSGVRIGVVAFAATATVVQPPSVNKEEVIASIDRFRLQRGTAIGSGILTALTAIFEDADPDLMISDSDSGRNRGVPLGEEGGSESPTTRRPAEPASYKSAAIILLSDGQATTGPDPMETARIAADRGVRIYTVGLGTEEGQTLGFAGWSMRVRLDPETLKAIAKTTGGSYYQAESAANLSEIYRQLSIKLVLEKDNLEITALFTALAALFVLVSAALSFAWFNRVL
jgi:Ca-activated chloride channel homolog